MNEETAIQTIWTEIEAVMSAQYPGMLLVYENHPLPDLTVQADPFMVINILIPASNQASMAESNPNVRYRGHIEFLLYTKENSGTQYRSALFDFLRTKFQTRSLSGIVFQTPRSLQPSTGTGWVRSPFIAPFHYDSLT